MRIIKVCGVCGKEFVASKMTSKYCSRRCERVAFRKRESEKKKNEKESAEALREEEKIKSLREIESFVIQAIPIYSLTNLLVSHEPFLPLESYSTCKRVRDASIYASKKIAQVSILERYFFVSTYQAAGPDTCLAVFVVASLPPCL